jgi:hypothetical protein
MTTCLIASVARSSLFSTYFEAAVALALRGQQQDMVQSIPILFGIGISILVL